jgi:hypothetical protein
MRNRRSGAVFGLVLALVAPAAAKEKVVRLTVGPFRVEAQRDREICQAVRVRRVPGMEVTSYEVRSLTTHGGRVGSHHLVVYGYRGSNAAAFPFRRSATDVVDSAGCNGFGPDDFFRNRVQLAGSGGEFRRGKWLLTRGSTPLGLAALLPNPGDAPSDAVLVINSHYFNESSTPGRGFVRVVLRLTPYDGKRRVVRNVIPLDASYDIDVPPGEVRSVTATWQADGGADPSSEGGLRPAGDVCLLLVTTHTHKRGTNVTIAYEEDGKEPVTLLAPRAYDYVHPPIVALPLGGPLPQGNLLRAYTAENGHPRLRYTCTHANGAGGLPMKLGCEGAAGVTPGIRWRDALAAGQVFGSARPCGDGGANCQGFGTGRCVEANLVFGPLSDDEMCIIPAQIYDPTPGAPPEKACDPYAF